ncbi:MAG: UDP-N-acetylglucosamine--N-acetylmuramyl-(pentapeptide) pyrophosphoryl-undecaprenol N-acetylglucosamine transferase, partial [Bacteroidia bacterium]|nr:UDP-N-acetylglucosamine--N-acetylmuramyl-(pentapeptide) pyrophosphoryl-undecaprenol N-acetylglucosamine transferase [Bacteroidia bacterium]
DKGAAILCKDLEAKEKIGTIVTELLSDKSKVERFEKEIAKLGLPQAAESIVNVITSSLG